MTKRYPQIRPATGEKDTGVVISFDCEAPELEETLVTPAGTKAYTINPLNWRTDATPTGPESNPGSCFTDSDGKITQEIAGLCGCYIDETRGVLKITGIDSADYPALIPVLPEGSFHIYDYQFFYRALEQNVRTRIVSFAAQNARKAALIP